MHENLDAHKPGWVVGCRAFLDSGKVTRVVHRATTGGWKKTFVVVLLLASTVIAIGGAVDILRGGVNYLNILFIMPGAVAGYIWHRSDKKFESGMQRLAEINGELVRRGHNL